MQKRVLTDWENALGDKGQVTTQIMTRLSVNVGKLRLKWRVVGCGYWGRISS